MEKKRRPGTSSRTDESYFGFHTSVHAIKIKQFHTPTIKGSGIMKLSIGSDHGGYQLKRDLISRLEEKGYKVFDKGSFGPDPIDYPDIAFDLADDITSGRSDLGVLICGTGIGMSNAASRVEGVVAALCTNEYMAKMARLHNDANILCLGARVIGDELAWSITEEFIKGSPMTDDKYLRRRDKVSRGPE
jgi:ribose 5-phosphate isomerase B